MARSLLTRFAAFIQLAVVALSSTLPSTILTDSSHWTEVELNGVKYTNKGLVGVGQIPSNVRDSRGDTVGGFGSACIIERGTWKQEFNGTYTGTMICHPDRGMNLNGTVDFQSRRYTFPFVLDPYYGTDPLTFTDALKTFEFSLSDTVYYVDESDIKTTGLDALGVRPQAFDYPWFVGSYPNLPIPYLGYNRISLDVEGLCQVADGSFWISDEYGPFAYHVTQQGVITQVAVPSNASLPYTDGHLNFTSSNDPPMCGRPANTGLEGLTCKPTGELYGLMQAALIQDGGSSKKTSRYTRFYEWNTLAYPQPELVKEYIVELPMTGGKTNQQSEMRIITDDVFLTLARDSYGWGDGTDTTDISAYKNIGIFSIGNATNILGSKYDQCTTPVAPDGVLSPGVTPAVVQPFINLLDGYQLGRLGMNNGSNAPNGIIDKFESITIATANTGIANDVFVIECCDNDFRTTEGYLNGVPFNAGLDIPNQCKIYLANMPGIEPGLKEQLGLDLLL